jgi:GntR family transcriptional regulator / MocR family aminotransferase
VSKPRVWEAARAAAHDPTDGAPRYVRIAALVEEAIAEGELRPGQRLPTVRDLSALLEVSGTTIVAAYNLLRDKNLIRGEVGRGTFVGAAEPVREASTRGDGVARAPALRRTPAIAWRRRALVNTELQLRAAHPQALDLTRGTPDPSLFPLAVLQAAWAAVADGMHPTDLQYPTHADTDELLAEQLKPRLRSDGIAVEGSDLIVGSSAQQFLSLAMKVARAHQREGEMLVAVEEPGYQTAMDTFERGGCRLVGVEVDDHGAVPESLDAALTAGALMVVMTPRAHSPTSASWTPTRRSQLAEVLARHPEPLIVEDDPLAEVASARPGSLLSDKRLAERVLYIRSFSKSIGADLRLAVAVAHDPLRSLLSEEKSFADGWTSRFTQRVLAHTLADPALDAVLERAQTAYAERRDAAARAIDETLSAFGGGASAGADGLHVWVRLPADCDSAEVLGEAAQRGFLAAPGDPFFVYPGHGRTIRLNAGGAASAEQAAKAGQAIGAAVATVRRSPDNRGIAAITV